MAWKVEVSKSASKELKKIGHTNAKKIIFYLKELEKLDNPRAKGKELKGSFKDFWRYRVGDLRVICEIKDDKLIVLVLKVGHRKNIYL